MKKLFGRGISFIYRRILKGEQRKQIVRGVASALKIDLLELAHNSMGIMKPQSLEVSGESYLLYKVLVPYYQKKGIAEPVLFDVGANKGDYSIELAKAFPTGRIYSFEPNPHTFKAFVRNTESLKNIQAYAIGFGSEVSVTSIYTEGGDLESDHASLFKNVFTDLHHKTQLSEVEINIDTIDHFCSEHAMPKINFLKVDTEGFEMEVMKGASGLLNSGKIDFIQFEFNAMNIISKVFLKDFYEVLKGYKFYRLDSNRLIPLDGYNPINEIFQFHNLLAVRENINIPA